jgi:ParB/RepB/Spo0J family partition protein
MTERHDEGSDLDPFSPGPGGLRMVAIERIRPCPYQPRVNVSVRHVRQLAGSIATGRHNPFLEVEPDPAGGDLFQIVCGEQRWRGAVEAGATHVLVRVLANLRPLQRLEKQYEENRLRRDLEVNEEAHALLMHKPIADARVAEEILAEAGIEHTPLHEKPIRSREDFFAHREEVRRKLLDNRIHLTRGGKDVAPLSPWRVTERALGISETARKAKLAILAQPRDGDRQQPVAEESDPSTEDVGRVVQQEEGAPTGGDAGSDVLAFENQMMRLLDISRQLSRLLRNLRPRVSADELRLVSDIASQLHTEFTDFIRPESMPTAPLPGGEAA